MCRCGQVPSLASDELWVDGGMHAHHHMWYGGWSCAWVDRLIWRSIVGSGQPSFWILTISG